MGEGRLFGAGATLGGRGSRLALDVADEGAAAAAGVLGFFVRCGMAPAGRLWGLDSARGGAGPREGRPVFAKDVPVFAAGASKCKILRINLTYPCLLSNDYCIPTGALAPPPRPTRPTTTLHGRLIMFRLARAFSGKAAAGGVAAACGLALASRHVHAPLCEGAERAESTTKGMGSRFGARS